MIRVSRVFRVSEAGLGVAFSLFVGSRQPTRLNSELDIELFDFPLARSWRPRPFIAGNDDGAA